MFEEDEHIEDYNHEPVDNVDPKSLLLLGNCTSEMCKNNSYYWRSQCLKAIVIRADETIVHSVSIILKKEGKRKELAISLEVFFRRKIWSR